MTRAYADIARLLRSARRRQAGIVLRARFAIGFSAALLCLLAGAVALASGARTPFRLVSLAAASIALLQAALLAVRDLLQGVRDDAAVVRTLGSGEPALRSALQSAIELARSRDQIAADHTLSLALVDGHLEQTAGRVRGLDLRRLLPDRVARRAGRILLIAVAITVLAAVVSRGSILRSYVRVLRGDPPGSPLEQEPITGDVELTYRYPAYMRREPKTLSGTGGEVRAPRGTEVQLRTRADRKVVAAELLLGSDAQSSAPPRSDTGPSKAQRLALRVQDGRDLSGGFQVMGSGSYRFRFQDERGRVLVEGPPIPVTVEPDAYPTARITAPEREVEVDPTSTVEVGWEAEDDIGLSEVALVLKLPGDKERRIPLRGDDPVRRDDGTYPLVLGPLQLSEGEQVSYRVEAKDGDTVSGPKSASSETQVIKIYSEAEHRRQVLERARAVFEEAVSALGDRLDLRSRGPLDTDEKRALAQAQDSRTRSLTDHLREAARDLRRDPAGPREVAQALDNLAQSVRFAVEGAVASRTRLALAERLARARAMGETGRPKMSEEERAALAMVERDDAAVERALEKGVLYLEQLLDKRRAEDLLKLAKNLSAKRRDLAALLEQYRKAPSEKAKEELLAQLQRMKQQVHDLLSRMAELSKGFNDEHMNEESLAELSRSQDLVGGLDEVERKISQGDVEGAMKALDQMAGAMDQMLAGLSRTAGRPDETARALMKDMRAFQRQLEKLEEEQKQAADETEKIRAEYRRKVAERLKEAEALLKRLEELAQSAARDVEEARPGVTYRAEQDYEAARESVLELSRALGMRELDGAADVARRATQPLERLNQTLEEDAAAPLNPLMDKPRPQVDMAQRRVAQAAPKIREVRDQLSRLFPDPRSVLSKEEQARLGEISKRQSDLEKEAAELQEALSELSLKAPIFPPSAQGQLSDSRGHMGEAASELGNRNPQRGHGEQELALDALARFRKGLEDAAKGMQQGEGSGGGFPLPFAEAGSEEREGDGADPSREKVKIPGAEAHKVAEAFRKDLLEAMKQGTPERYRADVQRYYEELVK